MHRAFPWLPSSAVSGSVRSFLDEASHKFGGWAKVTLGFQEALLTQRRYRIYCSALLELLFFSGLEDQPLRRHDRTGEEVVPRRQAIAP